MVGNMSFLSLAFTQSATLVFARTLGMALVTPALGGVEVAKTVRVLLAIAITAIVLPGILLDPSLSVDVNLSTSQYFWSLGLNALKEGIIGVAIGMTLTIFFSGVYLAGEVIGKLGGVSVAGSFDQAFGGEISAVSRLLFWVAFAMFIVVGGMEFFIDGYLGTFSLIPLKEPFDPERIVELTASVLTASFGLAIKIVAPVVLSTATVYLAVGFLGRAFPQMNLMSIGFNANSILALTILGIGVGIVCQAFHSDLTTLLENIFGSVS